MNYVNMTVDAGRLTLLKHRVCRTAGFARRTDCRRVVALAASGAVIAVHLIANPSGEFNPSLFPQCRVVVVMSVFGDDVPQARCDMLVGLNEPISGLDVAIAAADPYACCIGFVPRLLETWILDQHRHRMAGGAERICLR